MLHEMRCPLAKAVGYPHREDGGETVAPLEPPEVG